jgi:glycosyltransferase involved in cell wall biosynthesis
MSDMEDADRDSPRKIVFLLPSMSGGGAEKVILHILSYLDRTKFNPHLLLFQKKGVFLDRVPSDVPIHSLMDRKSPVNRWLLCFYYKKYISKSNPDVVVSFMWYPNIIVLLQKYFFKGRHKVIVSERNTTAFTSGGRLNGLIRRWGIRFFYPMADLVISLTYRMRQELLEMCNIKSGRIAVIRNFKFFKSRSCPAFIPSPIASATFCSLIGVDCPIDIKAYSMPTLSGNISQVAFTKLLY